MSDESEEIAKWIEAYKETQRQMTHAHEVYQRALAQSHEKYLEAIGSSQAKLLKVLEGFGVDPDQTVHHAFGTEEQTAKFIREIRESPAKGHARYEPHIVESAAPGKAFSALRDGATVCVMPDAFGVAEHLVEKLNARGFWATLSPSLVPSDVVISLAALQLEPDKMRAGLDVAMRAVFEVEQNGVVLIQDTGGRFATEACTAQNAYQFGLMGIAELAREVSEHLVKVIDLDVGYRKPEEVAEQLVEELCGGADELRVGLPEGARVLWSMVEKPAGDGVNGGSDGVYLITDASGGWDGLVEEIANAWKGRVLVVGEEPLASVDRIPCDLSIADEVYQALDVIREMGPIRRWLHLPSCAGGTHGVEELKRVWQRDLTPFHVIMAACAGDPTDMIAILFEPPEGVGHVSAAALRCTAIVENERRSDETRVVAICGKKEGMNAELLRELSHDGEAADVRFLA
ncbi:hypothetical protein FRD01_07560 [Microvenator marinus]|uniref:PH domain-containing protein n=1 Tax=Microvenator marinus TaxID=2600177 RepID=A0A5B8XUL9_9DELT|nr:hypothetical protein [Microvenator marinus]QED27099.1 hypothetical protein FRD01_07560 [Microvenator marinus]